MKRKALFVSYGAGHIAMVLPVMRALRRRAPDVELVLMALTTAAREAQAQGEPSLGYRDFVHWYDAQALQDAAAPLLDGTRHPAVDPAETQAYLGINLLDLRERLGPEEAARVFARDGRWAFRPLAFMRRVLQELAPDVVIATNSPRSEQAALDAAGELGIHSVCMVDLFSPVGDPFLARERYAERITTISELGRRNLVAGGVPADRIVVTGNPAFDGLFDARHVTDARADRERLGWQKLKVILWAGHLELLPPGRGEVADPSEFPLRTEAVLREYVASHPDTALVIRYHPNHTDRLPPHQPQERVFWSAPAERAAHRDIQLADVVVVQATTVGLEAAIAGKSVLSLDHSPSRHVFPCSEQGVSRGVSSFEVLPAALDEALAHPFQSELARRDAGAADEVARVILATIDSSQEKAA